VIIITFICIVYISDVHLINKNSDVTPNFKSFFDLFKTTSSNNPNKIIYAYKTKKNTWKKITYKQYFSDCCRFAVCLINSGLKERSYISIMGVNSYFWICSFVGCLLANMIPIGIYNTNSSESAQQIVRHSKSSCIIIDDQFRLDNFHSILREEGNTVDNNNRQIKFVIMHTNEYVNRDNEKYEYEVPLYSWKDFMVKFYINKDITVMTKNNDIATIIYTSGSTGEQKGAMITYHNILSSIKIFINHLKTSNINNKNNRIISYLPLNHITAQLSDIYLPLAIQMTVFIGPKNTIKNGIHKMIKEVKPTIFCAVPRVWEKIMEGIQHNINKLPFYKKILFDIGTSSVLSGEYIKEKIGFDKCQLFISASAPLPNYISAFFSNIDIDIVNIYGMTETTGPITIRKQTDNKRSVGKINENITLNHDNEILIKGPTVFTGYLHDPKSTNQSFTNGYFMTGDYGEIINDLLYITGRKKDIIVTSGGENVNAITIENNIKESLPIVQNAVLIGNGKKYVTAILTLKLELDPNGDPTILFTKEMKSILESIGSHSKTTTDIDNDIQLLNYINNGIEKVNESAISNVHKIKKWIIIPTVFTIRNEELTSTLKLRRKFIELKYSKYINKMY